MSVSGRSRTLASKGSTSAGYQRSRNQPHTTCIVGTALLQASRVRASCDLQMATVIVDCIAQCVPLQRPRAELGFPPLRARISKDVLREKQKVRCLERLGRTWLGLKSVGGAEFSLASVLTSVLGDSDFGDDAFPTSGELDMMWMLEEWLFGRIRAVAVAGFGACRACPGSYRRGKLLSLSDELIRRKKEERSFHVFTPLPMNPGTDRHMERYSN